MYIVCNCFEQLKQLLSELDLGVQGIALIKNFFTYLNNTKNLSLRNLTLMMLFKKVAVSIFVIILTQYFANLEFVHICFDQKTQISRHFNDLYLLNPESKGSGGG